MPFLTKSVAKEQTDVSSDAVEAQLEQKLVEVVELADKMETAANLDISMMNETLATLEARIAATQKRKMLALGRIERAAATRAQFQITPKT